MRDLAGAVFGASVAIFLSAALPARAAVPPQAVAIVLPEGRCEMRAVPGDAVPALRARLEQARLEAAGLGYRLAADAAAARFAGAREAVPAFGAWAYDWVQSYITAYRIAGRMVASVAATVRGERATLTDGLVDQMSEPMRRAFEERVLSQGASEVSLRADLALAAALVEAGWNAALLEAVAPLRAGPAADAATGGPVLRIDIAGAARVPVALEAEGGAAAVPGGDPASLFFHSIRPIAARVSAIMLRATEAGSVVAAVGALGYRLGGVPGLAAGAAGGVGVYWGIDFALNRADAALNREDFEAQALDVIARAEAAIAGAVRQQVLDDLGARLVRLVGAGGCEPGAGGAP